MHRGVELGAPFSLERRMNVANVYDFRHGRSIKNVNPQAVGEELERIRSEKGELTPANVFEAGQNENSPLHPAFEWDVEAAALQHNLQQARRLITSIRILNSPTAKPTVAWVSVRTPAKGRSYMPTIEAMSDEEMKYRVLNEIREALEAIERRYAHFANVADVIAAAKKAVG